MKILKLSTVFVIVSLVKSSSRSIISSLKLSRSLAKFLRKKKCVQRLVKRNNVIVVFRTSSVSVGWCSRRRQVWRTFTTWSHMHWIDANVEGIWSVNILLNNGSLKIVRTCAIIVGMNIFSVQLLISKRYRWGWWDLKCLRGTSNFQWNEGF